MTNLKPVISCNNVWKLFGFAPEKYLKTLSEDTSYEEIQADGYIAGVKDATGDLKRVQLQKKSMGNDFIQLTGNDDNSLEFNKLGGVGAIVVTANIAAKLSSDFHKVLAYCLIDQFWKM